MPTEGVYTSGEFLADMAMVKAAHKDAKPTLLETFDDFVARIFNERYGVNQGTSWRYGKFMLVGIYINVNRQAFNSGDLLVAGTIDSLVSSTLAIRVLKFAVENDLVSVHEFPPPDYFIHGQ